MALKLMKNKRADIAITILTIGVFAVCALALISFILYTNNFWSGYVNTDIFENLSSSLENYYLYVNSGLSPQQAAQNVGGQIQNNQLILNTEQKYVPDILGPIFGDKTYTIISVKYIVDLNK